MKIVTAAVCLLVASCVYAKDACDVELEGGVRITSGALEFTQGDKTRYKIINNQTLMVNDRPLALDSKQQLLVKQYSENIRALVPEVHQLAVDGVDLAEQAMGLAFQELLGPDNQTAKNVQHEFVLLKGDIEKRFTSGQPININQKGIQDNDFLDAAFEARISKIVESSQKEISWSVLKNLGATIFSSDDKDGDFEARMNKFGEKMDRFGKTMDREMNARAGNLERRAGVVCSSILALDAKEEELKKSVPAISAFNLIKLKNEQQLVKAQ